MYETVDLVTYYDVWVNGEALRRRHLFAPRRSRPPAVAGLNPSMPAGGELRLPLRQSSGVKNLDLRVDGARLEPIHQILVHGSQATGDTCGFSDVDVLVVLDDSRSFTATQHQNAVSELQTLLRSMFLYDCLMHHGFMFMLRSEFDSYRESFLPVETLRNALVIWGTPSITLRKVVSPNTKLRLQASIESLVGRLERRDHERDDYAFKSVLSGLLLMPSLLLASVDIFCYKRDSFALGPQEFPGVAWGAIRQAEDMRLRWRRPPARMTQHIVSKMFHPHAIIRLSRMYQSSANVRELLGDRSDAFTTSCQEFLDCIASL